MNKVCGKYGEEQKNISGFGGESLKKNTCRKTLGIDGIGNLDWTNLPHDSEKQRANVNTVVSFWSA
jgi:hypothetical protein